MKDRLQKVRMFPPIGFLWDMADLYFEKRVSRSAAELAYFLVLSLFPLLICVNAVVGMLDVDIIGLLSSSERLIPQGVQNILKDHLGYIEGDQPGLLTAGVAVTIGSSSAAFRALRGVMDDIYDQKRLTGPRQVVVSILYSVLLLVTIYVSAVVVLTGEWFIRLLERVLPFSLPVTNWSWLRFFILFCLVLALILSVYRLSIPREEPRPPLFTGALLATATLVAASGVFSWFIGMSTRYSLVYGSLASVIILLVWLYLCGNILILGNVFNCVRYRRRKGERQMGTDL